MDYPEREGVPSYTREEIARALSQWRDGAHLAAEFDSGQRRANYAEALERVVAQLQDCTTLQQLVARSFAPDGAFERVVAHACQAGGRSGRFRRSPVVRSIVLDAACWYRAQQLVARATCEGDEL